MKYILYIFTCIVSISIAQGQSQQHAAYGAGVAVEPFTFVTQADTISLYELRFFNPKSAINSIQLMRKHHGLSASNSVSRHQKNITKEIWNNVRLLQDKDDLFTVIADGTETMDDYFTSFMVFDANGDDCFTQTHPHKDALIQYFAINMNKYNNSKNNWVHKKLAKIQPPTHVAYSLGIFDKFSVHIPIYYINKDNVIYDREGKKVKNITSIGEYLTKLKNIYQLEQIAIYADKRAMYSTINKIKSVAYKSGIKKCNYLKKMIPNAYAWSTGYLGTISKLQNTNTTDMVSFTIGNDHTITTTSGQLMNIQSEDYKKFILSNEKLIVQFDKNLTYDSYIFWLKQTHTYLGINENKQKSNVFESLLDLE